MKVVDLRNIFANCNDQLIEISDNRIYYAEEKNEEGHNSLFLLEYNRITRRERILANHILDRPAFVPHFFSFSDVILLLLEDGSSHVELLAIDKITGEERHAVVLSLVGNFSECAALDESRIILFTEEDDSHAELFSEYRRLTGFARVALLFDLEEEAYYYLRDPRICNAAARDLVTYNLDGDQQLLVLQPHGDETEKWNCYRNRRWLGDNINDNVWLCPLFDFIVSAKAGEKRVPLELILSAGTAGLVRYAGMNAESIYFRAKHFPSNDQRLCAVDKRTGKRQIVAQLNLRPDEQEGYFCIDTEDGRAYKIVDRGDYLEAVGVLNSSLHARYSKELGDFITCVEDRFIIARYILADEKDSFEFHSIFDCLTGEQQSYECACAVEGGTVVLY